MDLSTVTFYAHWGLRYLVLTAGLLSAGYSLQAILWGRSWDAPGRILSGVFAGLIDLQVLLGIVLIIVRTYYPALIGHISLMILAAGAAHMGVAINKRRPPEERSHRVAAIGSGGAVILILAGIMAIGRSIV